MIINAFQAACLHLSNLDGQFASVESTRHLAYDAFELPPDSTAVLIASQAIKTLGLEPLVATTQGGIDPNWLIKKGIPTVSLGCGYRNFHTLDEHLIVKEFLLACELAKELAFTELNAKLNVINTDERTTDDPIERSL